VDHGHRSASLTHCWSGGVDCGRDDEMFMTKSLNVMPKTTEQHI